MRACVKVTASTMQPNKRSAARIRRSSNETTESIVYLALQHCVLYLGVHVINSMSSLCKSITTVRSRVREAGLLRTTGDLEPWISYRQVHQSEVFILSVPECTPFLLHSCMYACAYECPACDDMCLEGFALSTCCICFMQVPAALLSDEGTWVWGW